MSDPEKKFALTRLTDDELRKFVSDFASAHVPEHSQHLLQSIFMPLAFGALEGCTEDDLKTIGFVYEYLDKHSPRSVNGFPIFMSCRLMHKDDWARARNAIKMEIDRRKNIELPPLDAPEKV